MSSRVCVGGSLAGCWRPDKGLMFTDGDEAYTLRRFTFMGGRSVEFWALSSLATPEVLAVLVSAYILHLEIDDAPDR